MILPPSREARVALIVPCDSSFISCEGKAVSSSTTERVSPTQVKEITQGCATQDAWNEDETGSFWKALPVKSLSAGGKCYRVGKNYNGRQKC